MKTSGLCVIAGAALVAPRNCRTLKDDGPARRLPERAAQLRRVARARHGDTSLEDRFYARLGILSVGYDDDFPRDRSRSRGELRDQHEHAERPAGPMRVTHEPAARCRLPRRLNPFEHLVDGGDLRDARDSPAVRLFRSVGNDEAREHVEEHLLVEERVDAALPGREVPPKPRAQGFRRGHTHLSGIVPAVRREPDWAVFHAHAVTSDQDLRDLEQATEPGVRAR